MKQAVIVSAARTGLAKSFRGSFNITHGATMGGHAVSAAVERAGIDPATIEDCMIGCGFPEGATGQNIARQIAIRAGMPVTVSGMTVNRYCSSGLQTIALAAQAIRKRVWPDGRGRGGKHFDGAAQYDPHAGDVDTGTQTGDLHGDDRNSRYRGQTVRDHARGAG